jgi:hypothetical protein
MLPGPAKDFVCIAMPDFFIIVVYCEHVFL